ncbi:AraC family transcriptional regulator [Streptomyces xiaopingdaonensis]|uniref:AraC family transcriptional regulator n=1 Tax=Streptomyces xiaopingdaonensis TaxID=1565415 RepID=UPI0002E089C1|nr:helix-turn-helix domain-containing protein [Streptomyces xiaopingdaonensis]
MEALRQDTRGIVAAPRLLSRVRFRRRAPAPALRRHVEHYWLIDWDLPVPYTSRVFTHPCVNLALRLSDGAVESEAVGPLHRLFETRLSGHGRVSGVQFRPGAFRSFSGAACSPAALADRRLPLDEALPGSRDAADAVLAAAGDDARVAALDALLAPHGPVPDAATARAMALAHRVRTDRTLRRVDQLAHAAGLSVRSLQRLFATVHGIGPKRLIRRYRLLDALEHATTEPRPDWGRLAGDLGYSDQSHLVREFTAAVGVPPDGYVRTLTTPPPSEYSTGAAG